MEGARNLAEAITGRAPNMTGVTKETLGFYDPIHPAAALRNRAPVGAYSLQMLTGMPASLFLGAGPGWSAAGTPMAKFDPQKAWDASRRNTRPRPQTPVSEAPNAPGTPPDGASNPIPGPAPVEAPAAARASFAAAPTRGANRGRSAQSKVQTVQSRAGGKGGF
jgi:hypothetical protein